ncbi:MAG: hypothetical protein ACK4JF_08510 [Methylohalobius sp.]
MKALDRPDLSSLVAVIFHLMSCYTLRPCPRLAAKVAEHLEVLLTEYGEVFGLWQGTIVKMRAYWLQLACGGRKPERESFH